MEYCDYGHEARKVKRLPLGGGTGIFVCYEHYKKEMKFRKMRNREGLKGESKFDIPKWKVL